MASSSDIGCSSNKPGLLIGNVVRFREGKSFGGQIAAAIVTRVWSETCYNVKVLPDGRAPYDATSVGCGTPGNYIEI